MRVRWWWRRRSPGSARWVGSNQGSTDAANAPSSNPRQHRNIASTAPLGESPRRVYVFQSDNSQFEFESECGERFDNCFIALRRVKKGLGPTDRLGSAGEGTPAGFAGGRGHHEGQRRHEQHSPPPPQQQQHDAPSSPSSPSSPARESATLVFFIVARGEHLRSSAQLRMTSVRARSVAFHIFHSWTPHESMLYSSDSCIGLYHIDAWYDHCTIIVAPDIPEQPSTTTAR